MVTQCVIIPARRRKTEIEWQRSWRRDCGGKGRRDGDDPSGKIRLFDAEERNGEG